jgi:hypothetical protein
LRGSGKAGGSGREFCEEMAAFHAADLTTDTRGAEIPISKFKIPERHDWPCSYVVSPVLRKLRVPCSLASHIARPIKEGVVSSKTHKLVIISRLGERLTRRHTYSSETQCGLITSCLKRNRRFSGNIFGEELCVREEAAAERAF